MWSGRHHTILAHILICWYPPWIESTHTCNFRRYSILHPQAHQTDLNFHSLSKICITLVIKNLKGNFCDPLHCDLCLEFRMPASFILPRVDLSDNVSHNYGVGSFTPEFVHLIQDGMLILGLKHHFHNNQLINWSFAALNRPLECCTKETFKILTERRIPPKIPHGSL